MADSSSGFAQFYGWLTILLMGFFVSLGSYMAGLVLVRASLLPQLSWPDVELSVWVWLALLIGLLA